MPIAFEVVLANTQLIEHIPVFSKIKLKWITAVTTGLPINDRGKLDAKMRQMRLPVIVVTSAPRRPDSANL